MRVSPRALHTSYCVNSHCCRASLSRRRSSRKVFSWSSYSESACLATIVLSDRRFFMRRSSALSYWLSRTISCSSASLSAVSASSASCRRSLRWALRRCMALRAAHSSASASCSTVASVACAWRYASLCSVLAIRWLRCDICRSFTLKWPSGCCASNTGGTNHGQLFRPESSPE